MSTLSCLRHDSAGHPEVRLVQPKLRNSRTLSWR